MISEKYSVLMSVYYKEKPEFLKLSLDSMLNQTLKPDQIVIVKDGELTEELDEVINSHVVIDPKLFTIVELKNNIGLGLALNEGLKKCRNELVARMDTDDISLPERCKIQVNQFKIDKDLSIVGTMIDEFYDDSSKIISSRVVPINNEEIKKFSKRRSPFNHPTVMYKKSSVMNSGGYKGINRKEDIELFGRMMYEGYKAKNINKSLLLYRSNKDNFKRRKEWANCKSYICVIYGFWRKGHSSFIDLSIVVMGQLIIYLSPLWLLKIFSDRILREKKS